MAKRFVRFDEVELRKGLTGLVSRYKKQLSKGSSVAVEKIAKRIFSIAQTVVPVYSGTLKRSGKIVKPTKQIVEIKYTATSEEQWQNLNKAQREYIEDNFPDRQKTGYYAQLVGSKTDEETENVNFLDLAFKFYNESNYIVKFKVGEDYVSVNSSNIRKDFNFSKNLNRYKKLMKARAEKQKKREEIEALKASGPELKEVGIGWQKKLIPQTKQWKEKISIARAYTRYYQQQIRRNRSVYVKGNRGTQTRVILKKTKRK